MADTETGDSRNEQIEELLGDLEVTRSPSRYLFHLFTGFPRSPVGSLGVRALEVPRGPTGSLGVLRVPRGPLSLTWDGQPARDGRLSLGTGGLARADGRPYRADQKRKK